MFVRKLTRKNTKNVAVQIVHPYTDEEGKPRRKIVKHMGSVPPGEALEALLRSAEIEKERLEENLPPPAFFRAKTIEEKMVELRRAERDDKPLRITDIFNLQMGRNYRTGFLEVFGELYGQMGFDRAWGEKKRKAEKLFRRAVLTRFALQDKGFHSNSFLDRDTEIYSDIFYRMMYRVNAGTAKKLQEVSREAALLEGGTDMVLFDTWAPSFPSWNGDIRVSAVLFKSTEGLPLGYETLPGKTSDADAVESAVERMGKRMGLGREAFFADAGKTGGNPQVAKRKRNAGFRAMKHAMNLDRPEIFCWDPGNVEAHLAVSFAAFAMLRILRHRYNCRHGGEEPISGKDLLKELGHVAAHLVTDTGNGKKYLLASGKTPMQKSLYAAVGLEMDFCAMPADFF